MNEVIWMKLDEINLFDKDIGPRETITLIAVQYYILYIYIYIH